MVWAMARAARVAGVWTLVLLLIGVSTSGGCRKSREWSLAPAVPVSLTLVDSEPGGLYGRLEMRLPRSYERLWGTPFGSVMWRTPEARSSRSPSPLLTVTLVDQKVFPNGCTLPHEPGFEVLEARQVRADLFVARCGKPPHGKINVLNGFLDLQRTSSRGQWHLWCSVVLYREAEPRDFDDATAICSSMTWHSLGALPQPLPARP